MNIQDMLRMVQIAEIAKIRPDLAQQLGQSVQQQYGIQLPWMQSAGIQPQEKQGFTFPVGAQVRQGYQAQPYQWQQQQGQLPPTQGVPVQSFANMLNGGQAQQRPQQQWQQPNFAAMFQPQRGVMK